MNIAILLFPFLYLFCFALFSVVVFFKIKKIKKILALSLFSRPPYKRRGCCRQRVQSSRWATGLCLWLSLADLPAPGAENLDNFGCDGCGQGDADKDEALVDCVGEG